MKIDERAVICGLDAADSDEVLRTLAQRLIDLNYVKDDYADAVIEREDDYPTGLECDPVNAAIPHCTNNYSLVDALGVATLKHPVDFMEMGTSDQKIPVRIMLMPVVVNPAEQVPMLVRAMKFLDLKDKVQGLAEAKSSREIISIIGDTFSEDE